MSIAPRRAPVRPRVLPAATSATEPILLEELVAERLAKRRFGHLRLVGGPGSGRKTALRHLAHVFDASDDLVLCERVPTPAEQPDRSDVLWVHIAGLDGAEQVAVETLELAPWSTDDLIEYLLAKHPSACADVVRRCGETPTWLQMRGNALVWSRILDRLAAEPELPGVAEAIAHELDDLARHAEDWCAFEDGARTAFGSRRREPATARGLRGDRLAAFGADPGIVLVAGARAVARAIVATRAQRFPEFEIVESREFEALLWALPAGAELDHGLARTAASVESEYAAVALSLLHRRDFERAARVVLHCAERAGDMPDWEGAWLERIVFASKLTGLHCKGAVLRDAKLDGVDMLHGDLTGADLRGATCAKATWSLLAAAGADFSRVEAQDLTVDRSNFDGAHFVHAELARCDWKRLSMRSADLTHASLSDAHVWNVKFGGAKFESADLSGAEFLDCALERCDLRSAHLSRVTARSCKLVGVQLEGVEAHHLDLSHSDLTGAVLTGSRLREAVFTNSRLRGAGLAGIDWPGANLRHADLSHATFRFGGVRSGLVFDSPALWGSKTGFYTVDWDRDARRPPEEIRVANLRGADLRGAIVEKCDFELVDLRGAQFTEEQRAHFERCGAFLDPR